MGNTLEIVLIGRGFIHKEYSSSKEFLGTIIQRKLISGHTDGTKGI